MDAPKKLIGRNTVDCMKSGMIYGNASCIVVLRKSGSYYNLYYTNAYGEEIQIQLQSKDMNDILASFENQEVVVYGYSYGCSASVARICAVSVELTSN
jgi:hypothetical protein